MPMCRPIWGLLLLTTGDVVWTENSTVDCGPVRTGQRGSHVKCHEDFEANCTELTLLPKYCPEECPFISTHPHITCVYSCRSPDNCSQVNPGFAYPNEKTGLCQACNVVGCSRCASVDVCLECFQTFALQMGGRACIYDMELKAQLGIRTVGILILVVSLAIFAILHCISELGGCLPQEPSHEDEEHTSGELEDESDMVMGAIRQGLRHRMRCKIKDLNPSGRMAEGSLGDEVEMVRLPFFQDLEARFLAGVGLPLYHRWFPFICAYGLVMSAGTFFVYSASSLNAILERTGLQRASHMIFLWVHGRDQGSNLCGLRNGSNPIGEAMHDFAYRAAIGYLLLWVLGFAMTIWHAVQQRRLAVKFLRKHPSLAEFALCIEGFPPDAVDEVKIRDVLRKALMTEDLEVSVCYDFQCVKERVRELLDKLIVQADVSVGTYKSSLSMDGGIGFQHEEKKEVLGWLQPGSSNSLRNTGSVFAVFSETEELNAIRSNNSVVHKVSSGPTRATCLASLKQNLEWIDSDGSKHDLVVRDVICEPTDIGWEHMGVWHRSFTLRFLLGMLVIVGICVGILFLVFVPFTAYVIQYFNVAGELPSGVMMMVLGILVMCANWVVCMVLWSVTDRIGFTRKDRQDLVVFVVFVCLCWACFFVNLMTTVFPEKKYRVLEPLGATREEMRNEMSFEEEASIRFFRMLFPGSLFVGYLMWPVQGFVWPLVSNLAYLRFRHRGRAAPRLFAREAELVLEPLNMGIAQDYMGHIVQPASCSLSLFLASGVAWQAFLCLSLWSLFMILFQRYMHLRTVKRCFFTTERLDELVLIAWGAPLSMMMSASCFWAAKERGWPIFVVPISWLVAWSIYGLVLAFCVWPQEISQGDDDEETPSYNEVRARRFYDWHNCNPIRVLLSHCVDECGPPLTPYEVGKGYLQVKGVDLHSKMSRMRSMIYLKPDQSNEPQVAEIEGLLESATDVGSMFCHGSRLLRSPCCGEKCGTAGADQVNDSVPPDGAIFQPAIIQRITEVVEEPIIWGVQENEDPLGIYDPAGPPGGLPGQSFFSPATRVPQGRGSRDTSLGTPSRESTKE